MSGWLLLAPRVSNAQWAVYDAANFAKNAITAAQMMDQVDLMGQEVAISDAIAGMARRNLVPINGEIYPYDQYVRAIQEVIDTVNRGEPMHYYLPRLNARQLDLYRGYTDKRKAREWSENYELLVHTALNAQRGAFNTVQEELRTEDDERINHVIGDLLRKTEESMGNKDLAQLNNYHNNLLVRELQRQRHMMGALTQAVVVKQQHDLDLNAMTQYSADQFYLEAKFTVKNYSGAGGIRTISLD